MKKIIQIAIFLIISFSWAQVDYSSSWEDFYSYNNVKDFIKVDNIIYALVENAVFIYDINTEDIQKMSSVNGLSGESTSSIYYSRSTKKIIIGYNSGMLEIIDEKFNITVAKDIVNFNFSGSKSINAITEYNDKLYLSTSFAIVEYDIVNFQFGDTFFIGPASSEILINEVEVINNEIYAATENGIFVADVNSPNLIDYNNWIQYSNGNYTSLEIFNNKIYTSKSKDLYQFESGMLTSLNRYSQNILSLKASINNLAISTKNSAYFIDSNNIEIQNYTTNSTDEYYFNLNTAFLEQDIIYLGTQEFGILQNNIANLPSFTEIHPEGPTSNLSFSIAAKENHLWVVYGYYDAAYTPKNGKYSISHYNGTNWLNKPYSDFNVKNLVHVTFDYSNINKVYISSWGASNPNDISNTGGMLIVENDEILDFWNYTNSELEEVFLPQYPNYKTTRINGSAFDSQGNLWIANAWIDNMVKKYDVNGGWFSFEISSVLTNTARGLNELVIDKTNTIWIGTRRNGVLAFNENGNKKTSLITEPTKGSLPDLNVRTVQVDASNRIWIGTQKGLVVYYNAANIFNETIVDAEPIIILDDGIPKKLLGDQVINTIAIDGADNKWFGTESSGILQTSPDGTKILNQFNKTNSPLPSSNIQKISVDKSTGKVFFATDKGIVNFNSNVATYSESLPEVYAFPNPSVKSNEFITIDGRNGAHLPNGTNAKILDAAGNLVYETNVKEGQELFGGKVIWDKTNLAGSKVASGVYIVLLTANENTETTTTKIAIIN